MGLVRTFSLLVGLPVVLAFRHPGLLVSDQDVTRAKAKISAGLEPWLSSWNKLISLGYASASYTNNAVSIISRDSNGDLLWHDIAAAFDLALRWKISGNDTYAATAADILVAWADTLEALSGSNDDDYLGAGLQGYELANAAELLRDYTPFADSGLSAVTNMMTSIFLPMNLDFLNHALGSEHNVKHFFANWELCNLASAMAIGVLSENQTVWDFAIDYFKNGTGNGAISNAITNMVEEPGTGKQLGQGQEEGRDQGHSALDYQLLGAIGQQAWNQGEDLFGYNGSRILLGAEYFARYNLGYDVPFVNYTNGIVFYSNVSSSSRGAIRPAWELLYAHYVQTKGLDAPWTTAYLNKTLEYFGGFEGGAGSWGEGSGHYDGLGWGSLLYHMDDTDVLNATTATPSTASPTIAITTTLSTTVASLSDTIAATGTILVDPVSEITSSSASSASLIILTASSRETQAVSTSGTQARTSDVARKGHGHRGHCYRHTV